MRRLPSETVYRRANRLASHFVINKPAGDGPFPVIILMHGCGRAFVAPEFQQKAIENGFATIFVDSFSPRGISEIEAATTVCTTIQLRGPERSGDLVAAIEWASNQDWVDKNSIHAAGWSNGGWSIMDAVARENDIGNLSYYTDYEPKYIGRLNSIFCIYPWCGPGSHSHSRGWKLNIPTHIIICGHDLVVGDALTRQTISKLQENGIDIEESFFEKATHSFDERESIHPAHKFSIEYTLQAAEILVDFAKKHKTK
ncbi:MAG: prolyl oligopeptidase family serine peptidase [Caulobacterales bacterium]|nr:prolyl oligopeptidase family serine peptidase [Caulobacterales bacterium]